MLKAVLRNFTKFTGKHLCQSLFSNKVAGLRPEALAQVFPSEFCQISNNSFFTEHLRWLLLFIDGSEDYIDVTEIEDVEIILL